MILINSSPKNALGIFQPFLSIYVPIGVACLWAVAQKRGIRAYLVDEQIEPNVVETVEHHMRELEPPYVFGFSVLTIALKNALIAAKTLKKKYPGSLVVFGGIHPTAAPDEMLSYEQVDVVIRGEGEDALVEVYDCFKNGKDYTGIRNLSCRRDGKVIHNPIRPLFGTMDDYPPFPYELFAPDKRYDMGFVISSRGCPYRCIFCSNRVVTGKHYQYKSAEMIVSELEMLCHKYHQKSVLFLDDNFLVDKKRIGHLIDLIRSKGLEKQMTFNFQARGDNVTPPLLKDLFEAGFRSVFFGIETASERLMKLLKKDETVEQCKEGVRMAKAAGFNTCATFIYGLPTETHKDRMDCIRLTNELQLDLVRYNNATPYPGTELYEIGKAEKRLQVVGLYENFISTSTFIENPFRMIPLPYVPEGNTAAEIRRDLLLSYFCFYLDFERLRKMFFRTPEQNLGWFNPGQKVAEVIRKIPAFLFLGMILFLKFIQLSYYLFLRPDTAVGYKYLFRGMARFFQSKAECFLKG